MLSRFRKSTLAAGIASALVAPIAPAVSLNPDGLGQALIYPYFTVRSVNGNAFHTYLTVGNSTANAKALRVRVREGRAGRETLSFNLYLAPNDMWAAALVPTADGARVLAADPSCTDPPFANGALLMRREAFSGANADGFGDTLDRTREGFVEILEMATLFGEAAAAVEHNTAGVPVDCGYMRTAPAPPVAAPTGGLWGTLTLINVNAGQDFTLDAKALDHLASRPYFRPPGDPYPDFAAAEIDPVSVVLKRGRDTSLPPAASNLDNADLLYRSTWSRPVDAVTAVLMSNVWAGEYVLDRQTESGTDVVISMPTRHFYVTAAPAVAPQVASGWSPTCMLSGTTVQGDEIARLVFDSEARLAPNVPACPEFGGVPPPCPERISAICASSAVASLVNRERTANERNASIVFGSTTLGLARGDWRIPDANSNGWMLLGGISPRAVSIGMASLPSSTRINLATGQIVTGAHTYYGLPVVGFFARTFNNGQLSCAGASCQGTYGSAFPMRYFHAVVP